jgi:hypothetical protein
MRRLSLVVLFMLAVPCLAFGRATPQKAVPAKAEGVAEQIMALERAWGEADRTYDVTVLVKATHKGEDMNGTLRWTDTWVRRTGSWQCVAGQTTKVK